MFEHLVIHFGTNDLNGLQKALNHWGRIGFEVVGVAGVDKTIGLNGVTVVLKRFSPAPMAPADVTPGWKGDPWKRATYRWWSGTCWSEQVVDGEGSTPRQDWPG